MNIENNYVTQKYLNYFLELYRLKEYNSSKTARKAKVSLALNSALKKKGIVQCSGYGLHMWVGGYPTKEMVLSVKKLVNHRQKLLKIKQVRITDSTNCDPEITIPITSEFEPKTYSLNIKTAIDLLKAAGYEVWKVERTKL
jgi:hypothetical protein